MSGKAHTDRCCNPFSILGEARHKGKRLQKIPKDLKRKYPDLNENARFCNKCRKQYYDKLSLLENAEQVVDQNDLPNDENEIIMSDGEFLNESNNSIHSVEDLEPKVQSQREIELEEMLNGLKEKFSSLGVNDPERIRILTIAPTSWSLRKLAKEFRCSTYLANKAQNLKKSKGVLAVTTAKAGKSLSEQIVENVKKFYESDSNSRAMPGVGNKISIKTDDGRVLVQKRLLLLDLRGLYTKYKEQHPKHRLSFSKFARLRPKHCILMGASGTHSVCVCTIHQNCKLMLDAIEIGKLTEKSKQPLCTYKDCIKQIICENPKESCYLDNCKDCPGNSTLSRTLLQHLIDNNIEQVEFSSWTGTDRSTLQTTILPPEEFIEDLCTKLLILKPHSFIAKQQSEYIDNRKNNLKSGEVLVHLDFAENYKYVAQDASQAFHFNNDQCTVFPVVCYYKDGNDLKHKSFVFLSDSTKHDAAAVYAMQQQLIPEIKKLVRVTKIIYVSDGAKQHFKNRYQIVNFINHEEDFGIGAEWHFHATAHGKCVCDGIGATFKREAARASLLAKPTEAILDSNALFRWGKNYSSTVSVLYYSKPDHERTQRHLNQRFKDAPAVPGIQKNHCFTVLTQKRLFVKIYSKAANGFELCYV